MRVSEVKEKVREWTEKKSEEEEGLIGAHFLGSINSMSQESEFPNDVDVDLALVIDREPGDVEVSLPYPGLLRENEELSYEGTMLEVVYLSKSVYESVEEILSNPTLACEIERGTILWDTDGYLAGRKTEVSTEFSKEQWVSKRLEFEKALLYGSLQKMEASRTGAEAAFCLAWGGIFMAGAVAVAHLAPPTHRRGLVVMRELLQSEGGMELYEEVLGVLGFGGLGRDRVGEFCDTLTRGFDIASPFEFNTTPFSFKLQPHLRPYIIDSTMEMIERGDHREAMFWITVASFVCLLAIQAHGTEQEKNNFGNEFAELVSALELESKEKIAARIERARRMAGDVIAFCEAQVSEGAELVQA